MTSWVQETLLEKGLEIIMDPTILFSSCYETNRILGMVMWTYSYMDNNSLPKLYTSPVRPGLEDGHHYIKTSIRVIEVIP